MPPFVIDSEPASLLYLINLTAGLLDGDGHLIEIDGQGGHAGRRDRPVGHPHSPGRRTAMPPSNGPSTSRTTPAWSSCPARRSRSRGSRYFQRGRVELAPRARLIWGDIWLAGRYDRGELSERFQFERIVQDFEARRAGRLVYRDRFRWDGPWTADDADWYFGGALASASLFIAGPVPETLPEAGPALRRSVFRLDTGESCMRWCGHPAAVTSRPRAERPATGRELDRRARRAALASRLERPRSQPLVLDSAARTLCEPLAICRDMRIRRRSDGQNLTRKLMPPVNWLRLVWAPLTPKASAPAKSPRISGRISRHLTGCQLQPSVTSA